MTRSRLAALVLIGTLASFGCATFKPNPAQTEIDRTRKAALIVMNSITTGLGIYESMLEVADTQQQAGQVSTATLRDLATLGKQFASVSDQALTILAKVTSMPSLNTTVAFVASQLEPLITRLENSGKDSLKSFGFALRIVLDLLNQYAVTGKPVAQANCVTITTIPPTTEGCFSWAH